MRKNVFSLWLALGCLIILSLALVGCGGGAGGGGMMARPQSQQTQSKTDMLLAAGFKQIVASTPQQKARLQAMPQHLLFATSRGTRVVYIYADVAGCGCFYAGNQQNYQAFQRIAAQYRLAAEEITAAQLSESMDMGWDEWGEAGPW